ncbi:MAG: hypothetical protein IMZ71_00860, partial [Chloroflexi bacterium]|nr:hypothetical protein [Chloroflexota bacterium]
ATSTWGLLDTGSSSPSARQYHAMATTPSGVLLFGGTSGGNETWLFNTATSTWGLLDTGSASPSARQFLAMAALPGGDVLLFGGDGNLGDTWLFNNDGTTTATWTEQLTLTDSPSARHQHAMATTPSGVLLFGGSGSSGLLGDTWLFSLGEEPTTNTISVTSPATDATWVVGQTASITWTSAGLVTATTTIELSRNLGTSWVTLTTMTPTQGTYLWTVSGTTSANCFIRVTNGTTTGTSGTFTITHAASPASLSLAPATATIVAGTSTTYTLIAQDTSTNTWDVTSSGTYWIVEGGDGGTWSPTNTYTASKTGIWTVTASYLGTSTTATMEVTHSATVDRLVLAPATATILAGTDTAYTLTAYDTYTNTWDVTSSGTYSITSGAEGTWTNTNHYTSGKAVQWTVTGFYTFNCDSSARRKRRGHGIEDTSCLQ